MAEERKANLQFGVDASEVRPGLEAIEVQVDGMAKRVGKSGREAGKGIAAIGDGGAQAVAKVDSATRSIVNSILRTTAAQKTGEKGTADYYEALAGARGINTDILRPYLEQLRQVEAAQKKTSASLQGVGVSAGQTTAALRQLPAQITDIVTSLQGGQKPLTVLIQQGGQIKDAFGGIGETFKALGGQVALLFPTFAGALGSVALQQKAVAEGADAAAEGITDIASSANDAADAARNAGAALGGVRTAAAGASLSFLAIIGGFVAVAAAVATVVVAYRQGIKESDGFDLALLKTGNILGATTGQLREMAQAIGSAGSYTEGAAAQALTAIASGGKVASDSLKEFTQVALEMRDYVGQSVEDTAKIFSELGNAPTKAVLKLNESLHFLTMAQLEQIMSLEEHGDKTRAAQLAQEAYAASVRPTIDAYKGNLDALDVALRYWTDRGKAMWDALTGKGRQETGEQRIAALKQQLASLSSEAPLKGAGIMDAIKGAFNPAATTARLKAETQAQIDYLERVTQAAKDNAKTEAARQRTQEAGVSAIVAVAAAQEKGVPKVQQMNKALEAYRKNIADIRAANPESALLDARKIAAGEKAIREQFAEKKGAGAGAAAAKAAASAYASLVSAIQQKIEAEKLEAAGVENLTGAQRMRIKYQEDLKGSLKTTSAAQRSFIESQLDTLQAQERLNETNKELVKSQKQVEAARDKEAQDAAKTILSLNEKARALEDEATAYGMGAAAVAEMAIARLQLNKADIAGFDNSAERVAQIDDEIAALLRLGTAKDALEALKVSAKTDETLRAAEALNAQYAEEGQLVLLSSQERAKIVTQRKIELDYAKKIADITQTGLSAEQKQVEIAKLRAAEQLEVSAATNKVMQDGWGESVKQYDDVFRKGFADMLNNGEGAWSSFTKSLTTTFKTTVADQIYKTFAKPFVVKMVASILGITGGGAAMAAQAATGGGGLLGMAGNAASGISLLSSGFGMGVKAGASALLGEAGLMGALDAGGIALGAGNIMGGLGTIAGALGPIALGIGALVALSKAFEGEERTGGQFGVAFDGSVTNQRRGQSYTVEGQQYDRDFTNGLKTALKDGLTYRLEGDPVAQESAIKQAVSGTASSINELFKALGSSATLAGFSAGLETSGKGRGGVFAGGVLADGTTFGESGKGDNYAGTLYEKFSSNSPDFKEALENFTLDLKQSTVQALQSVSDIPQTIQDMLAGVDAEALAGDAADALLTAINAQIVGVGQLKQAFETMGLDKLAAIGFDAAAGLAKAAGGFDALMGGLTSYYANFYTEAERMDNATAELAKAFASAGVEMPATKDAYRALVTEQLAAGEAGQELAAKLLLLNGSFAQVTDYAEQAAKDAEQAAKDASAALLDSVGISAADMGKTFRDVLTGRTDAQEAGQALAQQVQDGIYNALAGNFADQLTDLLTTQLIQPVIQAAVTGASISELVSQSAIDNMVAQARAAAEALGQIFSDPAFRAAIDSIGTAISGALSAAGSGVKPYSPAAAVSTYTDRGYADASVQPAKDAWRDLIDGIVRQTQDATRELSRLGMTSYESALASIADKAQEQVRSLQDAGYMQAEREARESARSVRDTSVQALASSRAAGFAEDSAQIQKLLGHVAYFGAEFDRLSEALAKLPPEVQAMVDAETALLKARNALTAKSTLDGLKKEIERLGMTDLEKELASISDRADDYRKGLIDLGQGTAANIAAVKAWEDAMLDAAKNGGGAAASLSKTTDDAFAALQRAVDAQRTVVQETIAHMQAIFDITRDGARDLYGEVDSARDQAAAAGRAFIDNALANAQATGYMPDADALREALADVRSGMQAQQYATSFEAERDRLVLAGKLTDLKDLAEPQLTEAQRQLKVLEETLENARKQIDVLRGIDVSVLSVADAVKALAAAMAAEKAGAAVVKGGGTTTTGGGGAQSLGDRRNELLNNNVGTWAGDNIKTATQAQIDAVKAGSSGINIFATATSALETLNKAADAELTARGLVSKYLTLGGGSKLNIDDRTDFAYGKISPEDLLKKYGIPGYAVGTNYVPRDGLAYLHEGEAVVPRAYNSAASPGSGGNARLEALVEGLTAEVKRLQAIVAEGVTHQRDTAEILDNVTEGGNAMRQTAMGGV